MDEKASTKENKPRNVLIIDTNAFIRCLDLYKLAQEYDIYTTNNVLTEIKDKKARDKFLTINFDIHTKACDQKSFNFVNDFSKKTGDYTSLSFIDKEVIALGVLMITENGKNHLLRKSPPQLTEYIPQNRKKIDQFEVVVGMKEAKESEMKANENGVKLEEVKQVKKEEQVRQDKEEEKQSQAKEEEEVSQVKKEEEVDQAKEEEEVNQAKEEEEVSQAKKAEEYQAKQAEEHEQEPEQVKLSKPNETKSPNDHGGNDKKDEGKEAHDEEEEDEDDDDGGEWINNSNLSKVLYQAKKSTELINQIGVSIMTTDFAMQNVAIQMGIPILSVDGMVIRQTRKWVLECYACHHICNIPTKEFCPTCGNHTLTKLSVRMNDDGTMTYYRNPKKKINTRGNIFPIPLPKGGRSNDGLILKEDELLMGNKMQQLQKIEKDKERQFREMYTGYGNGMTFEDFSRGNQPKYNKIQFGYGKINPNDRDAFKKKKNKKR